MLAYYLDNNYTKIVINILIIFTINFSLKLIFDVIYKGIQAFKIIPKFIKMYQSNTINIKSIISFYYLQNIFFYVIIFMDLLEYFYQTFIEDSYLYIGIISSLIFIFYFPLKD